MSPQSRLERYERRTEWPLAAAVRLMIGDITLLGAVTATPAWWIVQRVAEEDTASQAATAAQINELREEIRQLTQLVEGKR